MTEQNTSLDFYKNLGIIYPMKRLLLRFFENKDDSIPVDSHVVCSNNSNEEEQSSIISGDMKLTIAWINKHPKGKVDVVWN